MRRQLGSISWELTSGKNINFTEIEKITKKGVKMATYMEALKTKTLWIGEPTFVTVNIGTRELSVGWNNEEEAPICIIEFNPERDGLSLYVNGKECASIILVSGSATFYHIDHIQKLKNLIQLFAKRELPP